MVFLERNLPAQVPFQGCFEWPICIPLTTKKQIAYDKFVLFTFHTVKLTKRS